VLIELLVETVHVGGKEFVLLAETGCLCLGVSETLIGLEVGFGHFVHLAPHSFHLSLCQLNSADILSLFGFVEAGHFVEVVVELSLQDHDFIEEELFLFGLDLADSTQTFFLILLTIELYFLDLEVFLGELSSEVVQLCFE
jgi:hypothetical protein